MSDRRNALPGWLTPVSAFMVRVSQPSKWFRGASSGNMVQATPSGVAVSGDSVLKTSTVWACLRYVSQTVAGLPWQVRQPMPDGKGSRDVPWTNPVAYMVGERFNPEMSSFQMRETMTHQAMRYGNSYCEIERDGVGRPLALWLLERENVQPMRDSDGVLFYRYNQPEGGYVDLPARDVFHIRGYGDGPVGLSIVEFAAQSIGWAQATELFGSTFFGQGMNPSMIISTTKSLTAPAKEELRKEFESIHRGPRKGGRFAIVDQGMKAEKVTNSAEESQFIETRQHQVEEICRWFGVPPHKVAHLLRSTFSNIEHQSIEVVTDCVYPWCKRFQDESNAKLFGATSRRGFYTILNLKGLLRGDIAARTAYYQTRRNLGSLSANEMREFEDENPIIGEGGDLYVMQGQYFTLEAIAAQSEKVIREANAPPPDPVPAGPPDDDGEDDEEDAAVIDMIAQQLIGVEK